ncbi:uncharacterized protein BJ171DRAFT_196486 [Polychytrium aggregatum]|uniref:uncharacterized protein n=1 Tax=Polychytrium aggregatum TaxID=110093 RepID=UPI0022FDD2DB|nr:uncharacterized protein BJ171DRAFT_196486 [Polychytrium aggregatum]KAI9201843.1 hypothetical protein BJ171DRAFT_196486 [Polychytrium aggregatum]
MLPRAFLACLAALCLLVPSAWAQISLSAASSSVLVYADAAANGAVQLRFQIPKTLSYFALGTGSKMSGSDIVVVWQNTDGSVTVSHRQASGHSLPSPVNQQAISIVANQASKVAVPSNVYVATVIVPSSWASSSSFIWAYVTGSLPTSNDPNAATFVQHARNTRGIIQGSLLTSANSFKSGSPSTPPPPKSSNGAPSPPGSNNGNNGNNGSSGNTDTDDITGGDSLPDFTVAHGYLMTFAWLVSTPIGIFIAQFFKERWHNWWFRLHQFFMFIGCGVLALVGFWLIFYQKQVAGDYHFSYADTGLHGILGLILTVLMLIQIVLGVVIDRLYNKDRTSVPFHDKLHWYIGRLVTLLAIVNIILGCILYVAPTWIYVVIGVWLALVVAVFVLLKVQQTRTRRAKPGDAEQHSLSRPKQNKPLQGRY